MKIDYISFESLLSKVVDNRGKTCPTTDFGIPLIATNCIKNDALYPSREKVRYVSKETYENWFRGHPEPGDMIFVTKGSPGRVCWVPDPVDFCIAQDMVAIRANPKRVYPKYLFAILRSKVTQLQIEQMHVGTMIPHFKKGDFDLLQLPIPDKNLQIFIGDLYFNMSAKIELYQLMNRTLETLTQSIFKSWFVDFDPVIAKADGKQPYGMNSDTAALFPSKFYKSELGQIPLGWQVSVVGNEFNVVMGQSPPGKTYNEIGKGLSFYQGRTDFGFRYPSPRVYCIAPTRFANEGDTLVSVRAPVGDINIAYERCSIGRGLSSVRHKGNSRSYTYYSMKFLRDEFDLFEGEGTLFGSMSGAGFRAIKIIAPLEDVVERFESFVYPLDQLIENNTVETKSIAIIRDTLIPGLLSGRIHVKQAEKIVEETV
jgi:type I restriction enzyme S subunit